MDTRRQERLELIVASAIKCFSEGRNTIRDIAEEARVPKASVHYYYTHKDDLYKHCVQIAMHEPTKRDHKKLLCRYYLDRDNISSAREALEP